MPHFARTDNRSTIVDDPFIKGYIDPLLKTIRTQVLLDICKPYTRIRIPFISQVLWLAMAPALGLWTENEGVRVGEIGFPEI